MGHAERLLVALAAHVHGGGARIHDDVGKGLVAGENDPLGRVGLSAHVQEDVAQPREGGELGLERGLPPVGMRLGHMQRLVDDVRILEDAQGDAGVRVDEARSRGQRSRVSRVGMGERAGRGVIDARERRDEQPLGILGEDDVVCLVERLRNRL